MTEWDDTGFVLLKKPYRGAYSIIHVFTKEHGKVAGLIRKTSTISSFANIYVFYNSRYSNGLGFFKILNCKELWVHFMYDLLKMKMLDNICNVLNFVLPLNSNESEIYDLIEFVYNEIPRCSNVFNLYQTFHKKLLELLGYGNNPNKEHIVAQINNMLNTVQSVA